MVLFDIEIYSTTCQRGKRVIAPDLIGFGKSDKFQDQSIYSYANHLEWLRSLVNTKFKGCCHVCSRLGWITWTRLVAENPSIFKGMVLSNTGLPTGKGMTDGLNNSWIIVKMLKILMRVKS